VSKVIPLPTPGRRRPGGKLHEAVKSEREPVKTHHALYKGGLLEEGQGKTSRKGEPQRRLDMDQAEKGEEDHLLIETREEDSRGFQGIGEK